MPKKSTPRSPNAEMPFLDHLEELRWRIIWSLLAVAVTVGLSFWALIQFDVIKILAHPILPYLPPGQKLVYTHPTDSFMIYMTLSIVLGVVGSIVGGLVAHIFSRPKPGAQFHPAGIIVSILGALLVLWLWHKFKLHIPAG